MKYTLLIISLTVCTFSATYTMEIPPEQNQATSFATKLYTTGVINNNLTMVKCGIWMGADVNFKSKHGDSVLDYACNKANDDIVKELLSHPAIDITTKTLIRHRFDTDDTPLHSACKSNRPSIVHLLLSKDPTLATIKNRRGSTPFDYAILYQYTPCIAAILHYHPELAATPNKKGALLHMATQRGDAECTALLLSLNRKTINKQDHNGCTPLHHACISGKSTTIPLLMVHGACATIKNNFQATPLLAMFNFIGDSFITNNPGIANELIHATDKQKNNQFHLCTRLQVIEDEKFQHYLSFLSSYGLDKNAKNNDGKTALNLACEAYDKLHNEYTAKKLPYIKDALNLQERIMHSFLRFTSPQTSCSLFTWILQQKSSEQLSLPTDLHKFIAFLYYKLNIETIIAKKYKNNLDYYHDFIENKNEIRQQLLEEPQPELLWNT